MKIKKFKARNFPEALRLVKQELSEHAIILASEEKKGLRPYVEVTAAIDYELQSARGESRLRVTDFAPNHAGAEGAGRYDGGVPGFGSPRMQPLSDASAKPDHRQYSGAMYRSQSGKPANDGNPGQGTSLPFKKKVILNYLRERSIREEFALRLCESARDLDDIPRVISADIRVANHDIFSADHARREDAVSGSRALMFLGPTGVGKTTTIAKLAARAIRNGRRVGIISLDTYRIGAIEQVRIYAKIMGIPLSIASNGKEFKNSLSAFAGTRDMIFIDTSGRNPYDNDYIREMLENVRIGFPLELHLLMSANYDDEFMVDTFRSYGKLPLDYLSITKIDESVRFGSLYNLLLIYQRPIAFLTTGQKVPDDIEPASEDRLVDLILKKRCYAC